MARIILLNGPPVNTLYKKNLHAFKNLASDRGTRSVIHPLKTPNRMVDRLQFRHLPVRAPDALGPIGVPTEPRKSGLARLDVEKKVAMYLFVSR